MDKILSFVKEKRYLGIAGNALVIVGLFLPLVTVSASVLGFSTSRSISYMDAETSSKGILFIVLAVVGLLMIFSDKLSDKVPFFSKFANQKLTLIPTGIIAILHIVDMMQVSSTSLGSLGSLVNISYGIGFWIMLVGLAACIAYPFLYKGENK